MSVTGIKMMMDYLIDGLSNCDVSDDLVLFCF